MNETTVKKTVKNNGADGPPPFRPSVGSLYGWTAPLIFLGEVNEDD